jgi:hypothetical protein
MYDVAQQFASSFNVTGMLLWRAWHETDSKSGKEQCGARRLRDTTLAIHEQLFHGSMSSNPCTVDAVHETIRGFVFDLDGRMPSGTPIKKVQNDLLVDEHNVAFNLLIKRVRNAD